VSFQDKSIRCSDCGTTFIFTAGQQAFFASKGFTNEPRRCRQCRDAKKQQRRGPAGSWASYAGRAMAAGGYRQAYR
jgi:hypothetical protein